MRDFATDLSYLDGTSMLITGGTGSFGKKLVKKLLDDANLSRCIIFSRDELKQFEMEQDLRNHTNFATLRFFIGDVRDQRRLLMALRGVDYVVHAAALKHVPIAEYNPFECIKTNILGAQNVAEASIACGVKKIIALSTDKAASPLNLYGASKLASDKIFVAANNLGGSQDFSCSVVRYGNVLGSRGSVIPFFRNMIDEGTDHLPITDMRMTRFWITIDQGVNFVLNSLDMMQGGEIYIPKIPSMKITDMARNVAPDLPQKEIGIRPGEKLHEEMITETDSLYTVEFKNYFVITPSIPTWDIDSLCKEFCGRRVEYGFKYNSGTNTEWITIEQLRDQIKNHVDPKFTV